MDKEQENRLRILSQSSVVGGDIKAAIDEIDNLRKKIVTLLKACQTAYKKHNWEDDSIGWNELSDMLHDTLCEVMGDSVYLKWVESEYPNQSLEPTSKGSGGSS